MLTYEKGAGKYLAPFLFFVAILVFAGDLLSSAQDGPFPRFGISRHRDPGEGCFVFAVSPYLTILDDEGDPVFFRKINGGVRNFCVQSEAVLTYFDIVASKFYALGPYYHIADSFSVAGGFATDFHSLQVLPDGHVMLTGIRLRHVDMSSVIPGGAPDATARDVILQELDSNNQVIFQWDSRDHFAITDADTQLVDLTASVIDYVHANTFNRTPDGNFLLTSRNMSEVTKIDRYTGEIIWRMGGKHNQFTDTICGVDIRAVHSAVLLSDTCMVLFDNGTGDRLYSEGLEYRIDQHAKTLQQIRNYSHEPEIFTPVMGNILVVNAARRLIGWGKNDGNLICTVYDTVPDPVMEIQPADQEPFWSYSVSFGRWRDSVLSVREDTVVFGVVPPGDSAEKVLTVANTGVDNMILTGFSAANDAFSCMNGLPERVDTGDSLVIRVGFRPDTAGEYSSVLLLHFTPENVDPATERIIRKVHLRGICSAGSYLSRKARILPVKIIPNPFHREFIITWEGKVTELLIRDVSGRIIYFSHLPRSGEKVSLGNYPQGIYFLSIYAGVRNHIERKIIKY